MYNFLLKYGQTGTFIVGALISVIFLVMAFNGAAGVDFDGMSDQELYNNGTFSFGLGAAIFLAVIALAAVVLFGIYNTVTNPKGALKNMFGLILVGVLFFILYSTASGDVTNYLAGAVEKFEVSQGSEITSNIMKFIGGGTMTAVLLIILAFAAFIILEIVNLFK